MGIQLLKDGSRRVTAYGRVAGRMVKKTVRVSGSHAKALQAWYDLKRQIKDAGRPGCGSLKCFADAIRLYREKRKPKAWAAYFCDRLEADLGAVRLHDLEDRFERYLEILKQTAIKRGKGVRRTSPATVNHYITIARACLNQAVLYELIDRNPLARIRKLKVSNARDRVLSPIERQNLLNAAALHRPHLLQATRFMLQVPIRKMELVRMRREDVDIFNGVLYLHDGHTKNDRGAILPIPPDMLEYFQNLPAGCPWVFYRTVGGKKGRPLEYRPLGDFKRAWGTILDLAGVSDFRVHDTRHVAAGSLARNGTPESVIMKIGNWKSREVFLRYRHIYQDEITRAVRFDGPECQPFVNLQTGTGGKHGE